MVIGYSLFGIRRGEAFAKKYNAKTGKIDANASPALREKVAASPHCESQPAFTDDLQFLRYNLDNRETGEIARWKSH